jgi:hypothetical protein
MTTQHPFRKSLLRSFAPVMAVLVLASPVAFPVDAFATDILMGTGSAGTFSHFSGRAVCRLISRHAADFNCQVIPAPDRIHNLTNLQGGSLDLALVEASMLYDAVNKKGYFEFLDIMYDNLTLVAPVYDQAIMLIARSDAGIDSLDQLKEKRINAGIAYSRTRQAVELILNTKGWSLEDFKSVEALPSSQSQDSMAFCHGSVQAMLHIGVNPDSVLKQLISLCNAIPVDMNDADIKKLVQGHPAYSMVSIPEGTYPTLGRSVSTIGSPVALVASGSLDDETVRTILSLLDTYKKSLQQAHPAMDSFDPGKPMADVGIPLHPGAAAFLEQR